MIIATPAYAAAASPEDQNFDPMDIKGKGVDIEAAEELINENSTASNETSNNTMGTLYTDKERSNANITYDNSTNDTINNAGDSNSSETSNDEDNITETTEEPVTGQDNDTENLKPDAENETITAPVLNTTGIVMQTSNYTCGPAGGIL